VESVDDMLRGNTDGGNEEFSAAVDDNIYKLVELAFGIIVAVCGVCELVLISDN